MIPLPQGPFNIGYMDVPWAYASRPKTGTRFGGGADEHYLDHDGDGSATMTYEELLGFAKEARGIFANHAYLWVWLTPPTVWEDRNHNAFVVMEVMGFRPVTLGLLWIKMNGQSPRFGQGFYSASNSELCWLAVRGRPWAEVKPFGPKISQILLAQESAIELRRPITIHSEKPDEARLKIVEFCGDLPRVELFSRHPQGHRGFVMWGNEIGKIVPQNCDCCAHLRLQSTMFNEDIS